VNKRGKSNVPYGSIKHPVVPTKNVLRCTSKALKKAKLYVASYEEALKSASKVDFVYLDTLPAVEWDNGQVYLLYKGEI
jgi:DNA adenine methylase